MAEDVKLPEVAPDVNFDPGVTSSVVAPSCLTLKYASVRPLFSGRSGALRASWRAFSLARRCASRASTFRFASARTSF